MILATNIHHLVGLYFCVEGIAHLPLWRHKMLGAHLPCGSLVSREQMCDVHPARQTPSPPFGRRR